MKDKLLTTSVKRNIFWIFCVVAIAIFDQLTKILVVKKMELHDEIIVIKNFFNLYYVRNKGAGLGLFADARWVFISVTTIVIIVVTVLLIKNTFNHYLADVSLIFILGGGIGNMIDRIFLGEVVDFFQFQIKFFDFIFNVADVFVTFGTIIFLFYYIFIYERQHGTKNDDEPAE